jgi:hypothetical protein
MIHLPSARGAKERCVLLIVATAAVAACDDGSSVGPPEAATFSQVQEVLGADCQGCHRAGSAHIFEVDLTAEEFPQRGLVDPAQPDQSLLILKPTLGVSHGGGRISGFTAEDKQLVESWIASLPPASIPLLSAVRVDAASAILTPKIDGQLDGIWSRIPSTRYFVAGGWADARALQLQAMYDESYLYLAIIWADDKASERRQPWVKQSDGTWKSLAAKTPKPQDGVQWADYIGSKFLFDEEDPSRFNYEDKLAIMWNTYGPSTVAGFDQSGCSVTCHDPHNGGQPGTTYYYSDENQAAKKYTNAPNEIADLWHWKLVRNNQHDKVDDQYVQYWVPGSGGAAEGGRASDEGASGYGSNPASAGGYPTYRGPDAGVPPYYIFDNQKIALTDQEALLFAPGTEIPNMITSGPTGFRADIDGKAVHDPVTRQWVMEIRRKLVTGDPTDVQFDNLMREYSFGVAVFDNAQIEHSYMSVVGKLTFAR